MKPKFIWVACALLCSLAGDARACPFERGAAQSEPLAARDLSQDENVATDELGNRVVFLRERTGRDPASVGYPVEAGDPQ